MDGVLGHPTRVAEYEGWVGTRGVCECLPCPLCILGHLCRSLDLILTRFECFGVIIFLEGPSSEGRKASRGSDNQVSAGAFFRRGVASEL